MHDRTGAVAPVDAKVEAELGRRQQIAVDVLAVEVDHHHLLGPQAVERGAGRRHRDELAGALGQVAGGAGDLAVAGKTARSRSYAFSLPHELHGP